VPIKIKKPTLTGLLKLTSPGMLLILAVTCACGIFLLDLLYLRPEMTAREWDALRGRASGLRRSTMKALDNEQKDLRQLCQAWAQSTSKNGRTGTNLGPEAVSHLGACALSNMGLAAAWLTDSTGNIENTWFADGSGPSRQPQLAEVIAELSGAYEGGALPDTGLVNLPNGVALFACAEMAGNGAQVSVGRLWLIQPLGGQPMDHLSAAANGPVVLLEKQNVPAEMLRDQDTETIWLTDENVLATSWPVCDAMGNILGLFQAEREVEDVRQQAVASRRGALIVSTLSVGLALLVILGTHMLITGPVVRLLQRVQMVESGTTTASELTRDMHGEPLVLARQVESAFKRMAHLSTTDPLTGLANRGHFQEVLQAFYHQARRYNRSLSVIAIDVDFFKEINDTAGHQAGDEGLKFVAAAMEKACRQADLPARIGGDEFAVLLPETRAIDAKMVAQRIHDEIAAKPVVLRSVEVQLAISVGITGLNAGHITSPEELMAAADRALYEAKKRGRNQVVEANDLEGPNGNAEESGKVEQLSTRLAGLDCRLKNQFIRALEEVIQLLAQRDPHMCSHTKTVQRLAILLARQMELPDHLVKRLEIAAILHDVGMLALPDSILLDPHPLSEEQMRMVQRHPLLSVRAMEGMHFLEQEIPAVRYHHERYDGSGYPEGLAGPEIPLSARVLAIADALDAMTSPRSYQRTRSFDEAIEELKAQAGKQFDPSVVAALASLADQVGPSLLDHDTSSLVSVTLNAQNSGEMQT